MPPDSGEATPNKRLTDYIRYSNAHLRYSNVHRRYSNVHRMYSNVHRRYSNVHRTKPKQIFKSHSLQKKLKTSDEILSELCVCNFAINVYFLYLACHSSYASLFTSTRLINCKTNTFYTVASHERLAPAASHERNFSVARHQRHVHLARHERHVSVAGHERHVHVARHQMLR